MALYGLATGIWAIDIYLTQLELYQILPNLDFNVGAVDAANVSSGIALYMRDLFVSFTVSAPSPWCNTF